ncbi:MAG: chloride channel protein [Gemmatimonadota bacterium]
MSAQLPRYLRHRLQQSEAAGPVLLAVLVGLLGGAWAILFRYLIRGAQWLFQEQGRALAARLHVPQSLGDVHLLVAPAVGLVIVVAIVRRWAPEARGHGVPEVQYAVRALGGQIRGRVALVKALASALNIGSGGSVGREGPIVQIGSTVGSAVGRLAGLGTEPTKLLVACGAAAGIGATFNAPIAGVLFALEVILGSFAARSFGLVVIASVAGTTLARVILGPQPAFHLPEPFTLASERELLLYLILGGLAGLVAVAYVRSVYGFEDLFERWRASPALKGAAGGLAVGLMAYVGSSLVLGVGYEGVEMALAGGLTLRLMLLLVLLKMLATSLTLAAGGSGGVFAPALFVGAMLGGTFGQLAQAVFPAWTAPAGAYALVGMAGAFGAAAHAPITAVLILFEMTDDSHIILPLMLTVGVSYLVASRLFPESIYSLKLRRLGGLEGPRRELSILDMLLVDDAMSEEFEAVSPELGVAELHRRARAKRTRSWPVVDASGELVGIVTDTDLEQSVVFGEKDGLTVGDVMTTSVVTLQPADTLRTAFRRFGERDVKLIPVVEDARGRKLVAVLKRYDMVWAYQTMAEEHERLLREAGARAETPET